MPTTIPKYFRIKGGQIYKWVGGIKYKMNVGWVEA
jgi:hypothetical protein